MNNHTDSTQEKQEDCMDKVPELLKNAVLLQSAPVPADTPTVKGYDWNRGIDYHALLQTYKHSGFQATNFGLAVDEIRRMLEARDTPLTTDQVDSFEEDEFIKRKSPCTIFLGYTSNMASCGVRDCIRFLVQHKLGTLWTPSKIITRLGKEIDNPESICHWAAKNKIPIFSPALTDGSLGDMMYFHSFRNPGLVIDILSDLKRLNTMAMKAVNSGMIIIGGGVVKHHICNANLMRNGGDYSVFINTSTEFDGSDSGARPDEAISWGKIRKEATPVKIYAEASLVFPLLVGETFARHYYSLKERTTSDV